MIRKEKLEELKRYIEELRTTRILDKHLVVDSNELGKCFLGINKYSCLLNNGEVIDREEILKNDKVGSAAVVVPVTKKGNTLLVVQPRVLTKGTVGVEFPAGYIEDGEDAKNAACRELLEETGYVAGDMIELVKYYQDQGCSKAFNYSYLATGCEKKMKQKLDDSEFIRYFECTYQEAIELADMGYINDANSLLALEKSKRYMRVR